MGPVLLLCGLAAVALGTSRGDANAREALAPPARPGVGVAMRGLYLASSAELAR